MGDCWMSALVPSCVTTAVDEFMAGPAGPYVWPAFVSFVVATVIVMYAMRKTLSNKFADIMTEHRSVFVVLFLLPLSALYDLFWFLRNKYIFMMNSAPLEHDKRVQRIQEEVRAAKRDGMKMCTARPTWLTVSVRQSTYKSSMRRININLHDILHLDEERRIVRCEPLVTMGQITALLNPKGWTLAILPELDDLTVGGLIAGFGVETSSFRYGLMQHICVAYEIVLPDGTLARCTPTENADLYYAIPWSYGALGFLVAAEIMIVPCHKYVKMEYLPYKTHKEVVEQTIHHSRRTDYENIDFIETLTYSLDTGVVMVGKMVPEADPKLGKVNNIGHYYKPWFYKHVESFLHKDPSKGPFIEYIPLRHYYHRHSRSIFWEMQDIVPIGNNPIFRYLMGYLVPPKISLLKLTMTERLQELYTIHHVTQDMLVPIKDLSESLKVFHDEFDLYPLWLCPMRVPSNGGKGGFLKPLNDCTPQCDDMFIDLGAYGNPRIKNFDVKASLRRVEAFVRKVKGFQALYADTYMDREEFRQMFDHTLYDKMRKKYQCEGVLPDVYDKVCLASRK